MSKRILLVTCLLGLALALVVFAQESKNVQVQTTLDPGKDESLYDEPVSTLDAFRDVLRAKRKPGGIVLQRHCTISEPKIQVTRDLTSLESALKTIVRQDPAFIWSLHDEVANLIPIRYEPEIMRARIKRFSLDGDLNILLALEKLLRLPELKDNLDAVNLNKGIRYGGLSSPREKPNLKFEIVDSTVRDILNEIVRRDGNAVWEYREMVCNGKTNATLELTSK